MASPFDSHSDTMATSQSSSSNSSVESSPSLSSSPFLPTTSTSSIHPLKKPSTFQSFPYYFQLLFSSAFILFTLYFSLLPADHLHLSPPLPSGHLPALTRAQSNDLTLNDQRCLQEFPAFYQQLELNSKAWMFKGGITRKEVQKARDGVDKNWGHAVVVIKDGQLFIRSTREAGDARISSLLHTLHKAITSTPTSDPLQKPLPPIELVFSTADRDGISANAKAGWAISKRLDDDWRNGIWLMPDFGFSAWISAGIPSFREFLILASKEEDSYPWEQKDDRAFWRGFANFYESRKSLLENADYRNASKRIWSDVRQTNFHGGGEEFVELVPIKDHCRRKYLIHSEGNSYSGRSKYLLSCNSVTIAHKLEWTQHFHPALNSNPESPHQNYVELPGKYFQNLEFGVKELWESDGKSFQGTNSSNSNSVMAGESKQVLGMNPAKQIADNASRTLRDRYLTPSATACYIRAALRAYSEVMIHESWGVNGVELREGNGVEPGSGKGKNFGKGDVEYGVWNLLGSPEWDS